MSQVSEDNTLDEDEAAVKREININRLVGSTQCSHITKHRGYSIRNSKDHFTTRDKLKDTNIRDRKTVHLYQDFASRGNLEQVIQNHHERAE